MSWLPRGDQIDTNQTPTSRPANKPASQRAATMPAEPEEEQVNMLIEITGMPRAQAVRYLKAKSNDISAAVTAFYEGEDISKTEQASQWDEGVWGAGKDGDSGNEYLHPLASSAAATRPNSPAPSLNARANLHPTSKQQEDDDFAQAMAMSQGDLGSAYPQETGRIGADGQQTFGPANRDSYEKGQWEMVPVGIQNTSEIVPDADAENRLHTPGEPRLLKHLPTGDYTPNLLTICHAIPGAREALLMRDNVQLGYGRDQDWWRGHPISLPKVVNVDDGSLATPEADKYDELIAEVQRLMAFLTTSARSYASIGALTQNEVFNGSDLNRTASRTLLELFLQQWTVAASAKAGTSADMTGLFSTTIGTNAPEGIKTPDMCLVNMPVNIPADSKSDLLEQLDDLLWDSKGHPPSTSAADHYIERPAEVLIMRAFQQNSTFNAQLRLEVPAEFHIDKYLPENIEATRATRTQMAEGRKRIAKIEGIEKKLMHWQHPTKNMQIETRTLLRHTLGHFSGQNRQEIINADKGINPNPDNMAVEKPHYQSIAQKLDKLISSIDDKLLTLTTEKEKTRKAIADMSKAPPSGLKPEDLKHRYTLRGVATKPNITYVLCPIQPIHPYAATEPSTEETPDDDTTPHGMRWWRMEYEVTGSGARIIKTKSADYDVLRAVELEHHSALLVYASDRVTSVETSLNGMSPLPVPLAEFVDRDTVLFEDELHAERNKPPAYDFGLNDDDNGIGGDEIYPSLERSSSDNDSTRAEGGGAGSDRGFDDDLAPNYEEERYVGHGGFGLGDIKQGYSLGEMEMQGDEAPVHEIKLSPPEEDEGVEMEEVRRDGVGGGSSDTAMGDGDDGEGSVMRSI